MDYLLSLFDNNPPDSRIILAAVLGGLIGVVVVAKNLKSRAYDVKRLKKPSGGHWLWGHELEAWETPDAEWYIRNTEEKGLVFAMKGAFGHPDLLVVSDPAALHHICTQSHRFIKSPFIRPFLERILGRGVAWAERKEHARQRQMVAPLFTAARVKEMDEDVQSATETFIDKFRHHITSNSTASQDLQVNVLPWLSRTTLDIIGKVALGYDFGCGESVEAKKIHEAYKELIGIGMTFPGFVGPIVLRTFPWIGNLPFGIIQAQGTVKTIVKEISRGIVDEIKEAGEDEDDLGSRHNLLGKLIKTTDANNDADIDLMLDQMCLFVLAGHETTTTALAMTLLELARKVDVQTALRKEIAEFKGSGSGGQLSYDDLLGSALPILDAVCKEGLRMCPVASHTERVASEDDVIPLRFPAETQTGELLSSVRVKKGQVFYIPSLAINMNTRMWGADGHKFDPYRWIEPGRLPTSSSLTGGINGHFTFLEGARLCVGYRLAIFEFKVILSALVRDFEFKTTNDTIQTMWATTLQPFVRGNREAGPQVPLFVKPVVN